MRALAVLCSMASTQLAYSCNSDSQFFEDMRKICPCLKKPSSTASSSTKSPSNSPGISDPSSKPGGGKKQPGAPGVGSNGPSDQNGVPKNPENGPNGPGVPNPLDNAGVSDEGNPSGPGKGPLSPVVPAPTCKEEEKKNLKNWEVFGARGPSVCPVGVYCVFTWKPQQPHGTPPGTFFEINFPDEVQVYDTEGNQLRVVHSLHDLHGFHGGAYSAVVKNPTSSFKLAINREGLFHAYFVLEYESSPNVYKTAYTQIHVTTVQENMPISSSQEAGAPLFTWNAIKNAESIFIRTIDGRRELTEVACSGTTTRYKLTKNNKTPIRIWICAIDKQQRCIGWGKIDSTVTR